ncbi:hypothetical protein DFR42_107291, partial [Undibacterium pigrum]
CQLGFVVGKAEWGCGFDDGIALLEVVDVFAAAIGGFAMGRATIEGELVTNDQGHALVVLLGGVHAEGGDVEIASYCHGASDFSSCGGVVIEDEGVELACQAQIGTGE